MSKKKKKKAHLAECADLVGLNEPMLRLKTSFGSMLAVLHIKQEIWEVSSGFLVL